MTKSRSSVRIARGKRGYGNARFEDTQSATTGTMRHINPLKHGYVKRVADWPYSTFGAIR
ncbi:MAG: hypothetical protein ACREV3_00695 [Gammaproteobacteria bacterium]